MPEPRRKTNTYGSCSIDHFSPPPAHGWSGINVTINFEEALKLNLALDECLRDINRLDRRTTEGRGAAVNLFIHRGRPWQITVNPDKVK